MNNPSLVEQAMEMGLRTLKFFQQSLRVVLACLKRCQLFTQ
ncbi:hypothetical protein JCM19240_2443 [Vibrio maritimus]|uniref:Uncharacterized protein n=1 Tax=Vibrio maritimus TaxID=990268 RepID=A0A090TRM0_9VIBR|nr:hypothetical protein JCM19240_2443 [Vibrio maritimus]